MEVVVYRISGSREDCESAMAKVAVGAASNAAERSVLLDTSAIIDGRVQGLILSGFLDNAVVPSFVVAELQQLADASDINKRTKGKLGLELLSELKAAGKVSVVNRVSAPSEEVDDLLVEMAALGGHKLLTCDIPLSRVASLKGVQVLSLLDLAEAMSLKLKVNDRIDLKIVKPGQDFGQGIGYLDDGTMVVVDGAATNIGQKITVRISNVHKASGGRLLFATTVAPSELALRSEVSQ